MNENGFHELLIILLLISAGGSMGGLTEFIRAIYVDNKEGDRDEKNISGLFYFKEFKIGFWPFIFLSFVGAFIGVVSAIALQFLLVLLDAAKLDVTTASAVFNISISAAAGFGGRRILPKMSDRIERNFIDTEARRNAEEANEAAEEASETAEVASEEAQIAGLYSQVQDAMKDDAIPSTRSQLTHLLESKLEKSPLNRRYNIWLGRLLFRERKYEEAIQAIDRFLAAKRQLSDYDKDYADLNFNKACYLAQVFGFNGNEVDKNSALDALREAVRCSWENVADAQTDEQLEPIRGLPEFQKILEDAAPVGAHQPQKT